MHFYAIVFLKRFLEVLFPLFQLQKENGKCMRRKSHVPKIEQNLSLHHLTLKKTCFLLM